MQIFSFYQTLFIAEMSIFAANIDIRYFYYIYVVVCVCVCGLYHLSHIQTEWKNLRRGILVFNHRTS